MEVQYTSDKSFIISMLWGSLKERLLYSARFFSSHPLWANHGQLFSAKYLYVHMYVINYGHLQSQNVEMLSCAHAQMNWFYNLRRVRSVSCGEATLRKNWPSMPGK